MDVATVTAVVVVVVVGLAVDVVEYLVVETTAVVAVVECAGSKLSSVGNLHSAPKYRANSHLHKPYLNKSIESI